MLRLSGFELYSRWVPLYLWLDIQDSAVIFRKRSDFEIQFYLIVLSFTFKRISRDHGNGFSRSQESGI